MAYQGHPLPARRRAESFLFLSGPRPSFEGQHVATPSGLVVHKVDASFLERLTHIGITNLPNVVGECGLCIQNTGTDSTSDLLRPTAFHEGLVLTTDIRSRAAVHIIREIDAPGISTVSEVPGSGMAFWGHFREELSMADVAAAEHLLPRLEPFHAPEEFSRVGNALLFYRNGYNSDNADLALISFTTCLESLFSTMEQELSFRLSLRVATFLADESTKRREIFEESKEVYRVRSKVVHGAKIHKKSETAAIYLVEGVVPQAERLARKSLTKVLELKAERLFENSDKLNALFDSLIFSDSLERTLSGIA